MAYLAKTTRYIAETLYTDWRYVQLAYSRPVFDKSKTGERTTTLAADPAVEAIQQLKEKQYG